MDISSRSSNFNSAQMATDQREGRPVGLSESVIPSPGNYQTSSPHYNYNPCSLDNWSRYGSQPGLMSSFQRPQYNYPTIGTEPYNLAPSYQDQDQVSYLNAYASPHINPVMKSSDIGLVEFKEQFEEDLDWKSAMLRTEEYYPAQLDADAFQPAHKTPPSPLSTISPYPSPQSYAAASPARNSRTAERLSPRSNSGDIKDDRSGNPPYSILIYQALIAAEGNQLSLQGIYRWFEKNTDKGRDSNHKGWQNSIRHNLSMNAGFEAVKQDMGPGKKAINFWRLTPEAIKNGTIQSTTRYRRGSRKGAGRVTRRDSSVSQEGHAAKKAKIANTTKANPQIQHFENDYLPMDFSSVAYMHNSITSGHPNLNHATPTMPSIPAMPRYGMDSVSGCTAQFPDNNGVFVGGGEIGSDFTPTFAMGHGWYGPSSGPSDGTVIGSNIPVDPRAAL